MIIHGLDTLQLTQEMEKSSVVQCSTGWFKEYFLESGKLSKSSPNMSACNFLWSDTQTLIVCTSFTLFRYITNRLARSLTTIHLVGIMVISLNGLHGFSCFCMSFIQGNHASRAFLYVCRNSRITSLGYYLDVTWLVALKLVAYAQIVIGIPNDWTRHNGHRYSY